MNSQDSSLDLLLGGLFLTFFGLLALGGAAAVVATVVIGGYKLFRIVA